MIKKLPLNKQVIELITATNVAILVNTFTSLNLSSWCISAIVLLALTVVFVVWYSNAVHKIQESYNNEIANNNWMGRDHAIDRKQCIQRTIAGKSTTLILLTSGIGMFLSASIVLSIGNSHYVIKKNKLSAKSINDIKSTLTVLENDVNMVFAIEQKIMNTVTSSLELASNAEEANRILEKDVKRVDDNVIKSHNSEKEIIQMLSKLVSSVDCNESSLSQ